VKRWVEQRGWSACDGSTNSPPDSLRTNMAYSSTVIADMDGDGSMEIVITGNPIL